MVRAGLGYLTTCDAPALGTAAQAEALIGLEQAEARHTAARARILSAFSAGHGFQADGQFGAKPWLRAVTKVTRGAAAGTAAWARRLAGHPVIAGALATGRLSASWARQLCDWTDQLPEDHRADADAILLAAAVGGADLPDLGALAREMAERARTGPDRDQDGFADRAVWLARTIGGAGRLAGDLTPAGAAARTVVLDALPGKAGPEGYPHPGPAPPRRPGPGVALEDHLPPRRHHHRHQPRRTHPALPQPTRTRRVKRRQRVIPSGIRTVGALLHQYVADHEMLARPALDRGDQA